MEPCSRRGGTSALTATPAGSFAPHHFFACVPRSREMGGARGSEKQVAPLRPGHVRGQATRLTGLNLERLHGRRIHVVGRRNKSHATMFCLAADQPAARPALPPSAVLQPLLPTEPSHWYPPITVDRGHEERG